MMTLAVRRSLIGGAVLAALIAIAGCSHYLLADREPWRHDAELACINSGVPEELPGRVRISTISGPGACGIDYPLKVAELGENRPLGHDDEPPVPPASIPQGGGPQQWPVIQSQPLPPPQPDAEQGAPNYPQPQYAQPIYRPPPYNTPQYQSPPAAPAPYGSSPYRPPLYASPQPGADQYGAPQPGAPLSLSPPGLSQAVDDESDSAAHPDDEAPSAAAVDIPPSLYSPRPMTAPPATGQTAPGGSEPVPPLGPPAPPPATAGPVEVKPPVTLACPIISALDKWVGGAVQPAALKWFGEPVVEIRQIGGYSCRGMNGDPNAHISEHAFGNALDIAEFDLADGHRISVQYGWHGTPEEQGFLRDVQGAACQDFTTVLAPGANVYHYNHIHVDLMRRASRRYICEPSAISGEVAAVRARARYAAQHGYPGITGSIKSSSSPPLGYSSDDDHLPLAIPGAD